MYSRNQSKQAKTNENNIIICWPEEVYEQVWNEEDLEEGVQEKRRGRV